jgi:hypothetical protein
MGVALTVPSEGAAPRHIVAARSRAVKALAGFDQESRGR